ncbi:MAG: hypothetical protein KCHDKBKB_02390 [Elusimicrobia bacterium]|nr:hypothetical protein [Elusimicrobiota bacterium]
MFGFIIAIKYVRVHIGFILGNSENLVFVTVGYMSRIGDVIKPIPQIW